MTSPLSFTAFGDLGVDSTVAIERLPSPDEKLWAHPVGDFSGGMMGNAAAVAADLGLRSRVIGTVGTDSRGQFVLDELRTRNVNVDLVQQVQHPTFWTLSLTTPTGDRALIQFPTSAFSASAAELGTPDFEGWGWLHTTLEQGAEGLACIGLARSAGCTVSLDVEAPFVEGELAEEAIAASDVVFMNSVAATAWGGPKTASARALSLGPEVVIVTLGADGCMVHSAEVGLVELPSVSIEAVDTNGAGDAFAAAFCAARSRKWDDVESGRFANAVAAATATKPGGHPKVSPDLIAMVEPMMVERWWGDDRTEVSP